MKLKELIGLVALVVIDLLTKSYFTTILKVGESIKVIESFFYITYVQNKGAAWGILVGETIFFYLVTILAIGVIGYWYIKSKPSQKLYRFSLILILAGTLGNFIDRVIFKYVRDFLDFYIFGYDFPVFNVADMCLSIGVALIMYLLIFKWEEYA